MPITARKSEVVHDSWMHWRSRQKSRSRFLSVSVFPISCNIHDEPVTCADVRKLQIVRMPVASSRRVTNSKPHRTQQRFDFIMRDRVAYTEPVTCVVKIVVVPCRVHMRKHCPLCSTYRMRLFGVQINFGITALCCERSICLSILCLCSMLCSSILVILLANSSPCSFCL